MGTALYSSLWTVDPGATVPIMTTGNDDAVASLVRLHGLVGCPVPSDYLIEHVISLDTIALAERAVPSGSYAITEEGPNVEADSAWRWTVRLIPTLVDRGSVIDWGSSVFQLRLAAGWLVADWGSTRLTLPIDERRWSEVTVSYAAGAMELSVTPVGSDTWYRTAMSAAGVGSGNAITGRLTFGRGFNGKIEAPVLTVDDRAVASWDFAGTMTRQSVEGTGPGARTLQLVNAPRRAVTGSRWTGTAHDWRACPEHYAAIHFHDDDLSDCCWPESFRVKVPDDARSGIYAVRLDTSEGVSYAPLFVRACRPARVAFLASTFSYLAYGNSIWDARPEIHWATNYPQEAAAARSYGVSTYCRHRDGTGTGLVSMRRPLMSFQPGFIGEAIGSQVLLPDDMRIIAWLDRVGEPYDVVTDHDLHERGASVLAGYDVLVTGVHPEYHSTASLDALHALADRGGRLMYMGGNGFYWRVSTLSDAPHVMEVRRAEGGIRTWEEVPGEYHHQSDGLMGGMWRRLGRAPNKLVGVGYSAQGSEDVTQPYARTAEGNDPRVAFMFDGVTDTLIGTSGPTGAAAGYETDRADTALGTPPNALVVARSLPFTEGMSPVNEERLTDTLLTAAAPLRADIVYYERPNGGRVFSAGSVLFAGCLHEPAGVGRVAENVIRKFLADDASLPQAFPDQDASPDKASHAG